MHSPKQNELAWADTCFPTDVYTRSFDNGFQLLKSFDVGGAQGSPLSPIIFPAAIDSAMKATMANYPGVKLTAIQDDIDIMAPPGLVFGAAREDGELQPGDDPGALRFLLAGLAEAGLEPNPAKFQLLTTTEAAAAMAPDWLSKLRPFHITDADYRATVEELERVAAAAAEQARLPLSLIHI